MEIKQKLQMIQDLMGQVVDSMEPDHQDFMDRLGKKPKAVVAIKIGEKPTDEDDSDMSADDPEEMDPHDPQDDMEEESMAESTPDDMLKKRLMKLRR